MSQNNLENDYLNELMLMVGYGTFITSGLWEKKKNPTICRIQGFRRVFNPDMAWFPFAIKDPDSSFLGICFDITPEELTQLDRYEGVGSGLYVRLQTPVIVKETENGWIEKRSWIYIPSKETMEKPHFPYDDVHDRWLSDIIRQTDELRKVFPEFFVV